MSNVHDFVIVHGVLEEYTGSGKDVVIPEGVTTIGAMAFYNCFSLTNVTVPSSVTGLEERAFCGCSRLQQLTLPEGVTVIADQAFRGCRKLERVSVPDSVTKIGRKAFAGCDALTCLRIPRNIPITPTLFGDDFPKNLVSSLDQLYPQMTDTAIHKYLLRQRWKHIPLELQIKIFLDRQTKTLLPAYRNGIRDATSFGEGILGALRPTLSAKECTAIANFMHLFVHQAEPVLLNRLYQTLIGQKAALRRLTAIEADPLLMEILKGDHSIPAALSPLEQIAFRHRKSQSLRLTDTEDLLRQYYGLTFRELPVLLDRVGRPVAPELFAWLLTAHETLLTVPTTGSTRTKAGYLRAGLCPEAAEMVELLDNASLQKALSQLADRHLCSCRYSKNMFLVFPLCRYGDEAIMAQLTDRASRWRSSVADRQPPALQAFLKANGYSNTRAAMVFACLHNTLEAYAKIRNTTEDTLWDQLLLHLELDATGCKQYDLGNQTVAAVLQRDLDFLVLLPSGKAVKGLPKQGADPKKLALARKNFRSMKQLLSKVAANRTGRLLKDFLSGQGLSVTVWHDTYRNHPVLRFMASMLVWQQGKNTFTLNGQMPITADNTACALGSEPVFLAHPMEMSTTDLQQWQEYFLSQGLTQPFEQIREPVAQPSAITQDRYAGCPIPLQSFLGQTNHGINVTDWGKSVHALSSYYSDSIDIAFRDCTATIQPVDTTGHYLFPDSLFEIREFRFRQYTRQVNHIVAFLDQCTLWHRIMKDDGSVAILLPRLAPEQIAQLLKLAMKNHCPNVTALLLEYQQKHFPRLDPMAEFTLD